MHLKISHLFLATLLLSVVILTGCTPAIEISDQDAAPTTQAESVITVTQDSAITPDSAVIEQSQSAVVITPEKITLTANHDGQTALELLSVYAEIETKSFGSAGEFIESINGKAGNADQYWAFFVNGEYAQQGADATLLQKGDVVTFEYQTIEDAPVLAE